MGALACIHCRIHEEELHAARVRHPAAVRRRDLVGDAEFIRDQPNAKGQRCYNTGAIGNVEDSKPARWGLYALDVPPPQRPRAATRLLRSAQQDVPVGGHIRSIERASDGFWRSPLVQMKAESEHSKLAYHIS